MCIIQAMSDSSDDIYNLYKECEECGACCELTVLAVTEQEIGLIAEYIVVNHVECEDRGPGICPFQGSDRRCRIYPVRPTTCRLHSCRATRLELERQNPSLNIDRDVQLVDMRMAFLHGIAVDPRTMPEDWIVAHYSDTSD